jgi:5'-nucleotidase / UDP-sugar diphosphatase
MIQKFTVCILLIFFFACQKKTKIVDPVLEGQRIVILYTNDEHGWMRPTDNYGGAAGLVSLWQEQEGYTEDGPFLILSGGDMWTGPAISTWFKGESMAEVMNAMHYDAAAIGNHEFDFKIPALRDRIAQSSFPFLSANIREKATGNMPDFAIPYIVKEVNDVKIGIIGLTSTSTPLTTFPDHVADYNFIPYTNALNEIVPQVKNDGAELLIVVGHICLSEMQALVATALNMGISVIGGGHCNELVANVTNDVALIEGGYHMESYARLEIYFDTETNQVNSMTPSVHYNTGGTADVQVKAVVDNWETQMNDTLSHVIGYADQTISDRSNEMYNMITDSWLITFPVADVSLTNIGGIRQSIPSGDITLATLVGVLPFENTIVELELTGQQLTDGIYSLVVGGMTTNNGFRLSDGRAIHSDSTYTVLTTDYLYSRPDYNFQYDDADPYRSGIHYRQPVIDWIESLNTSAGDPLNNYLDSNPR